MYSIFVVLYLSGNIIKDCTPLTSNKHGDESGDNVGVTVVNNHIVAEGNKYRRNNTDCMLMKQRWKNA
jgi:hypothetical protein